MRVNIATWITWVLNFWTSRKSSIFKRCHFAEKKIKRRPFVSEIASNECVEFREEILKIGRKKVRGVKVKMQIYFTKPKVHLQGFETMSQC